VSIFLDTRGNSNLGIGICDRCRKKFPINELQPDRNTPGLLVCEADNDEFDPWRLPARATEDITLPHYRPDVNIGVTPDPEEYDGDLRITQDDFYRLTQGDDLDGEVDDDYRITEVLP
jgi:hypothetical protein